MLREGVPVGEGEVQPERVLGLIERLAGPETFEISLADTIGCAAWSERSRIASRTCPKAISAVGSS